MVKPIKILQGIWNKEIIHICAIKLPTLQAPRKGKTRPIVGLFIVGSLPQTRKTKNNTTKKNKKSTDKSCPHCPTTVLEKSLENSKSFSNKHKSIP